MKFELDSWDIEWNKNSHSMEEYRQKISEQQERIFGYLTEIAALRQAIATIYTVALKNLRN